MDPLIVPLHGAWPFTRRVALLFLVIYCAFTFLEFLSGNLLDVITHGASIWDPVVAIVGKYVLHLEGPLYQFPTGSGDTSYGYTQQFSLLVLSLIIALVWAVLDRKRPSYDQLAHWLRIGIRYYLAYYLLVYGSLKVIQLQFPSPGLYRLTETYGASSPMGLAWTFVGLSKGYNFFTGSAEMLAGLLLFFRRTTLLGALLAIAVMANVVVMNFTFDIPVKLFSLQLLLLAMYLAAYDWRRLYHVFVLNKPAPAAILRMPQPVRWKRITGVVVKVLFILLALSNTIGDAVAKGDHPPKVPLHGLYRVQTFVLRGDSVPPLTTDSTRWKEMILEYKQTALVRTMTGKERWMRADVDEKQHRLRLQEGDDSLHAKLFYYEVPKPGAFVLRNDSMQVTFTRLDEKDFNLTNRGFHWISEYPFNR